MALPHQSIATINSPQFINLQPLDVNPLMSLCEIKVLYIGENRNRSFISKETAIEMAKTLRGAPIVGYYKENKEDFADHGDQVILDDEGIHFNNLTKPYGFVAPDAKVWFQKFNDSDDFGNTIERQYLMTTGYLWTGQYEQVQSVLSEGKPQSMELDDETLDGHWATDYNNNIEFFIINDAIFTKLCILGDDTEPCFEGAAITRPEISATFSQNVDDNFKKTLFNMIQELKDALKGGNVMGQEDQVPVEEFSQEETSIPETDSALETSDVSETENLETEAEVETDFEASENSESETSEEAEVVEDNTIDDSESSTEFAKEEEKEEEKEDTSEEDNTNDEDDEEEDKEKNYSLLEQQYEELSTQYAELKEEYDSLVEFKNQVENERKDALINEFYMLSEEDKKDIIEHKTEFTLDEIKAKLAVICYEKKVSFNSENSSEVDNNIEQEVITMNFDNSSDNLPDWVKAVKDYENNI